MRFTALSVLASGCILFSSSAHGQTGPWHTVSHGSHAQEIETVGYRPAEWSGQCSHCSSNCYAGDGSVCMHGSCQSDVPRQPGFGILCRHCATKAYPDAGWAPPAHLPVNRDNVWYRSYVPQVPYGSSGGGFIANYPQVYQPNDTTQLGYTYQHVPTWQSRPGMIPGPPNPADYHSRTCPGGPNCTQCSECYGDSNFGDSGMAAGGPYSHWTPISNIPLEKRRHLGILPYPRAGRSSGGLFRLH